MRAVGDVYKAIADPTRRALLDELQERDDQTLFELCARLATRHGTTASRQAITQHLDVLCDAGLAHRRKQGRYVLHTFDPRPLRAVAARWRLGAGEDPGT